MKVAVTLILLGALAACADGSDEGLGASSGALSLQEPCASDQTFTAWCGYKNHEDLAPTPDGKFLLATGFGGIPDPVLNEITLTDLGSMERHVVEIVLAENTWGSASCARATTDFSTHGLDIVQRHDGRHMVAMTNHLPAETVELFELAPVDSLWQLVWRGCVEAPSLNSGAHLPLFNDVALTAEGSFYVTEMYNGKMPFEALIQAGLTGANTGQVWQWSLPDGFRQVTGTEGSFPNGIVLSADASELYINYWFSGLTTKFDLGTGAVVGSHQGGRADNLTIANGSVWAAKHDMSVAEYLEGCPVEATNCFLPFSVHRLDLDDLREQRVWRFDSQVFGFGTVATPVGEHVWLGSAHGDRIARFDLKDR